MIHKIKPCDLSDQDRRQCQRLTLADGDMINVIIKKARIVPGLFTYFLAKEIGFVLGWAILTKRLNGEYEVDFFVNEQMRGRKVGTRLADAIIREVGTDNLYAYPYDEGGRAFFAAVGIKTRPEWDGGDVHV